MAYLLLITGKPNIGKTTVLKKTIEILKERGYRVGGMLSQEAREAGIRVGFEVIDVNSNRSGWLAHTNLKTGPRVGKYHVNIADLDNIGTKAINTAVEDCDIIVIDEIGPMELFAEKFKIAVKNALGSNKYVIAVVHWKAKGKLIHYLETLEGSESFVVSQENRDELSKTIAEKVQQKLVKGNLA